MMKSAMVILAVLALAAASSVNAAGLTVTVVNTTDAVKKNHPYIIGHRGAPYYFPDHTLASYTQAIEMGADFIECDMVLTKDLQVVCRHEPWLDGTTDAVKKFPKKVTTRVVDGQKVTSVFACDLTLKEIKMLRTKQPLAFRNQATNFLQEYLLKVPTLDEYIALVQSYKSKGRVVGIEPEIKHSTFHNSLANVKKAGTTFEAIVQDVLESYNYYYGFENKPEKWLEAPIFIQSFEVKNLQALYQTTYIPLVQLIDEPTLKPADGSKKTYKEMLTPSGLAEIRKYANTIGPHKSAILSWSKGCKPVSTGLVASAHAAGLMVHSYTWRPEAQYVPACLKGDFQRELDAYVKGEQVDGMFVDAADYLKSNIIYWTIRGFNWDKISLVRNDTASA